jgi:hypothetical protein
MDLSQFPSKSSATKGAKMQLRHPVTGDELPGFVLTVAGADSHQFVAAKHEEAKKRMEAAGEKPSMDDIELGAKRVLAACVIDWGSVTLNGKAPTDNLAVLIEYPWIAEQIDAFVGRRANFIPTAQKV